MMPKFGLPDEEPVATKPAMDMLPPATKGAGASIQTNYVDNAPMGRTAIGYVPPAAPQLSEAAQLAKIELEKKQWEAEHAKQNEDWMVKKWRPAMGWCYMVICVLDMAIFPVLWSIAQVMTKTPMVQWSPLTLQGAGLFHLAMGAVLGIAAWSRGQEKIQGVTK
jgi:hypothetical protein